MAALQSTFLLLGVLTLAGSSTADPSGRRWARRGAIAGGVAGLIFPPGIIASALVGGAAGGGWGRVRDKGFKDEDLREIGDSLARVERLTGRRPTSFAYPYGNLDAESEQLVEDSGFECACATLGTAVTPGSRLFALPRKQVGDWDLHSFAAFLGSS